PVAWPAQAMIHGTGYLLAAGVLSALSERQSDGRGRLLRFSLAWTAHWLMHGISSEPVGRRVYEPTDWLTEIDAPYGRLRHELPPLHYPGSPGNWAAPPTRWGTAPAPRGRASSDGVLGAVEHGVAAQVRGKRAPTQGVRSIPSGSRRSSRRAKSPARV